MLVILDFRINSFDLLPDFIGYILVAIGCGGLGAVSRRFHAASTMAWILLVLSVIGFVLPGGSLYSLLRLVSNVADSVMMWQLLGGIMELADAKGRMDLMKDADTRRMTYVLIAVVATLISLLFSGGGFISFLVALAYLVVLVLILRLIHRVKTELLDGDTI